MRKRTTALLMSGVLALTMTACRSENMAGSGTGNTVTAESAADHGETGSAARAEDGKEPAKAAAGSWTPSHDITIRVPKGAGDTMDTITRLVGQSFTSAYKTNVIVNNLTGANGAVAAADLMAYDADPCEMMSGGIVLFTLAPLFSKDITMNLDDWTFVCGLTSEDFVLVANAGKGFESWEDVVEYGRSNRLLVGTQASGGAIHMLASALCGESGIESWEAVTSDSSGKDILACSNGTVDIAIATTSACGQYIDEGTVIPILTFGKEAYKGYEGLEVPTASSLGYDLVWQSLNYLMTRSDVDGEIVEQMYQAISAYCETDEFKKNCETAGIVPYICDGDVCWQTISEAKKMCEEMYAKYYE